MEFNSKLPNVKTTIFTIMSKLAKEHNAINLSQGFPDFDTDPKLIELVSNAMKDGYNQYAPMQGVFALREQVSEKFNNLYQSTYHPDTEITITSGATQAIFTIVSAFIHKDDEVIMFKPAYDCYEPAIDLHEGKPVYVQLEAPNFRINWNKVKQLINTKTKMIIINSPHNPSGTIWSKDDMLTLENIVKDTDIIVLSDEVYEHIIFDGKPHQSLCLFPYLKERSFIVASFGKTFHNTGWKIGYCVAPKALMHEFRKVHQFNVFCVNHPMQIAFAEYLKNENNYLSLNNFYQEKRDFFLNGIKNSRFKFIPSQGTYFQLLGYSAITDENDIEFAKRLVVEHQIATIPISVFNTEELDQKMLRFCFAKKEETLQKAIEILCEI
ncbi:MAG TPA: methionine aminotransferase [Flavobacteriaceae bacterium]|jgi:methionine aminotransferase|nr:methionine aminotransferase [Flavobacteriaceae bacterium]